MTRYSMTNWLRRFTAVVALVAWLGFGGEKTFAQATFKAVQSNGTWSASSSWNMGAVPGASDYAYIGDAAGGLSVATISLTGDQSAQYTFLGNGDGTTGTLQLGNNTLSGYELSVGSGGTGRGVVNRGTGKIALTGTLTVYNSSFAFGANDTSSILSVLSGTASTASAGNVGMNVNLYTGSTLTLNSSLNLTDTILVSSSTVNAQNYNITSTNQIVLNPGAVLNNRGSLTTTKLTVKNQSLNLQASDAVGTLSLVSGSSVYAAGASTNNLVLSASTATTNSISNVTRQINLDTGSTLTLNSNLTLSSYLFINNSTVDANFRTISTSSFIQLFDPTARLANRGNLIANQLFVTGQTFDIRATDVLGTFVHSNGATTLADGTAMNILDLTNVTAAARTATIGTVNLTSGTILTEKRGLATGLTLTGTAASALSIDATSKLRLEVDGAVNGWVLRWANPAGGNHVTDLNSLISAGKIDFTLTNGGQYFVSSNADGFTYVLQPVPEPATTMLIAVGGLASGWVIRRRRLASAVV